MQRDDDLSRRVIGCAIEVHRTFGPGLLEGIYEACLYSELRRAGIAYVRQQKLPVTCKGEDMECDLRLDLVVERCMVLEVRSVQQILPVHEAQLLTYLCVSRHPIGLLMNCNEQTMKRGKRRRIL